jgi:MFS transporter, SP family, general alpha glucoside:H+ symporter
MDQKVVPTERELDRFDLGKTETIDLIQRAQESDAADRKLTLWQALKKYKKAVFWSCVLSTALVMEGYDVVIVRRPFRHFFQAKRGTLTSVPRSTVSSVKPNSRNDSELLAQMESH